MTLLRLLIVMAASFVATVGFAPILHAPKKTWLPGGLVGMIGYTVYWVLKQCGADDSTAMLVGSALAATAAQFTARRMRMIATIFVTLAIFPCVPGYGLYHCMSLLGQGLTAEGAAAGIQAMEEILMIALGVGVSMFVFRQKPPASPAGGKGGFPHISS